MNVVAPPSSLGNPTKSGGSINERSLEMISMPSAMAAAPVISDLPRPWAPTSIAGTLARYASAKSSITGLPIGAAVPISAARTVPSTSVSPLATAEPAIAPIAAATAWRALFLRASRMPLLNWVTIIFDMAAAPGKVLPGNVFEEGVFERGMVETFIRG